MPQMPYLKVIPIGTLVSVTARHSRFFEALISNFVHDSHGGFGSHHPLKPLNFCYL